MYWKTIAGRCIHHGTHGSRVYQNMTYRWLTLGSNALQTLIHRRHPERAGLAYIRPLTLAATALPGASCLLGLGGANIAHTLAPIMGDAGFTAVESSQEVIGIASSFFMTTQLKHLTIIHQDAHLFVQHHEEQYQHLMIDLFDAHSFPAHCNTADFFEACRRCLLPGGVLAVNLANLNEQWPILQLIRQHFPQCTVLIPVRGTANLVVLAYNGPKITPLLDALKQDRRLKKLIWCATWGCVATV